VSKPEFFLWVDLETTGLSPKNDKILEMALVLTDTDFNELGRGQYIFSPDIAFRNVSKEVKEMHTKNGLWEDVINASFVHIPYADNEIRLWLEGLTRTDWREWKKIYLAGSSVHFDVGFLRENYFGFVGYLSHRYYDVSVFRTAMKLWSPSKLWEQNGTHRAMDDVLDHIEEAKYYRRVLT
jgi:oligoribonuclease